MNWWGDRLGSSLLRSRLFSLLFLNLFVWRHRLLSKAVSRTFLAGTNNASSSSSSDSCLGGAGKAMPLFARAERCTVQAHVTTRLARATSRFRHGLSFSVDLVCLISCFPSSCSLPAGKKKVAEKIAPKLQEEKSRFSCARAIRQLVSTKREGRSMIGASGSPMPI